MTPIQVIGDPDTVLAFALGGVEGQVARTATEARAAVQAVVDAVRRNGGPGRSPRLVLVTHHTAALLPAYLAAVMLDASAPLVLEIPGFGEPPGERPLQRFVERVLGIRT
jgi:vacuolar-type H+-ATPase subunit F/Vma7